MLSVRKVVGELHIKRKKCGRFHRVFYLFDVILFYQCLKVTYVLQKQFLRKR